MNMASWSLLAVYLRLSRFRVVRENAPSDIVRENRMVRLPSVNWGWTCNSHWQGFNKSWTLTIPAVREGLVIQGMRYNAQFNQIEAWGYIEGDNNVVTKYKDDVINPERTSGTSGQQSDGRAKRTPQPRKPQECLT